MNEQRAQLVAVLAAWRASVRVVFYDVQDGPPDPLPDAPVVFLIPRNGRTREEEELGSTSPRLARRRFEGRESTWKLKL